MSSSHSKPRAIPETRRATGQQPKDGAILIAGAGIAGLASAIALARAGIASHVIERRGAFDEEGAGIQIGPNGTRILSALGVAPLLRDVACAPESIRVCDGRSGRELQRLPLGPWIAERHGAPYWTARRGDLHAALLQRALDEPRVRLTSNTEVTDVTQLGGAVSITTASGASFTGPALIAADGMWSRLRSTVTGGVPLRFTGKYAVRTLVPAEAAPEAFGRDTYLWLSPGLHVVHYPVAAGRKLALVVIKKGKEEGRIRDWSIAVEPNWVAARTAALPEPVQALIAAATGWRMWPLYDLPAQRALTKGRIALVGDAGHPVLPFLAQGGVLALEDAVVVAGAVAGASGDIPAALERYARLRVSRVMRVAAASRRNGRIYHLSGPAAWARDLALTHLSGERFMAGYDWLYGWRAEDSGT